MPCRFSNHRCMLRRWLPDATCLQCSRRCQRKTGTSFAKSPTSVYTLEYNRVHNSVRLYACGAAIIRPASGFLKSILQSDFVCFKFLIGIACMNPHVGEPAASVSVKVSGEDAVTLSPTCAQDRRASVPPSRHGPVLLAPQGCAAEEQCRRRRNGLARDHAPGAQGR